MTIHATLTGSALSGRNEASSTAEASTVPCSRIEGPNPLQGRRVTVIIPAYNEERFIGSVALKARRYTDRVIVVDDGSSDDTAGVARLAGAQVIVHERNRGKGAALNSAFDMARQDDPEVVVMLDADGQHLPEELCRLALPVLQGQADLVVGSRYLQKSSHTPRARILGHRFFNLLTRLASGVPSSDSQSGYRAFSPKALQALAFSSKGFSVESEMQFIAHEHGLRLLEVPITIRYTDKPKRPVVQQGLAVLNGVLRLVGQYRPLFFFGGAGFILLLIGLGWGFWVVDIYRRLKTLAVGYAMISVLLTIIGMVTLSTGVILHSVRGLLTEMLSHRNGRKTGSG